MLQNNSCVSLKNFQITLQNIFTKYLYKKQKNVYCRIYQGHYRQDRLLEQ